MESHTNSSTAQALTTIGIDIGKEVFHIVGFDADGKIALRRKIKRLALSDTFKKLPPCVVGMEACLPSRVDRIQSVAAAYQAEVKAFSVFEMTREKRQLEETLGT